MNCLLKQTTAWISRVPHKRHYNMHKVSDCGESITSWPAPISVQRSLPYCLPLHPTRPALSKLISQLTFYTIIDLSLPLSTLNATPYDATPMTRGFGGWLSLSKQRAFTSNLLPIYLGALAVPVILAEPLQLITIIQ